MFPKEGYEICGPNIRYVVRWKLSILSIIPPFILDCGDGIGLTAYRLLHVRALMYKLFLVTLCNISSGSEAPELGARLF